MTKRIDLGKDNVTPIRPGRTKIDGEVLSVWIIGGLLTLLVASGLVWLIVQVWRSILG